MPVRVLIAEKDPVLRGQLREIISHTGFELTGVARDSQEALQLVVQSDPHVVLVSHDLPGVSGLVTCEMITALAPDVMPILVSDSKTQESMDGALRSGARAVVYRPMNPSHLTQRIEELAAIRDRRYSEEFRQWKDPTRYPRIVSVTGARGGVGKSTVASNLSVVLAEGRPDQVLLFDLYTQFGDIPTMLNIMPRDTVVDLLPVGTELDVEMLHTAITKHPSGIHVMITSMNPMPLDMISNEYMDNLLYLLKQKYRYIVMDVPPILHRTTMNALSQSNQVLLIANLFDLTTVTDTRKFFDATKREQIATGNIGIVLNRVARENRLQTGDVERLFECEILGRIPNDSRLVDFVNQGVPLAMRDADCPFTRSISALARRITGSADSDAHVPPASSGRGLFRFRK